VAPTAGQEAERLVEDRIRAALPQPEYRVFANVEWLGRTRDHGQLSRGEADLVIAHPERGFLVVETKSGEIRRDAEGRWYAGVERLDPDPFVQAERSLRALMHKLDELPDRPLDFHPIAGQAVALPDIDLAPRFWSALTTSLVQVIQPSKGLRPPCSRFLTSASLIGDSVSM
jgi:hypothetical protein